MTQNLFGCGISGFNGALFEGQELYIPAREIEITRPLHGIPPEPDAIEHYTS